MPALFVLTALLTSAVPAKVVYVVTAHEIQVRVDQTLLVVAVPGLECPSPRQNRECAINMDACQKQRAAGRDAVKRARELLAGTVMVGPATERDPLGRWVSSIKLADGRDYAQVMVEEGICRPAS